MWMHHEFRYLYSILYRIPDDIQVNNSHVLNLGFLSIYFFLCKNEQYYFNRCLLDVVKSSFGSIHIIYCYRSSGVPFLCVLFAKPFTYLYAPVLGRKSEQMCHPALADVLKTPTSADKHHLNPQNRYRRKKKRVSAPNMYNIMYVYCEATRFGSLYPYYFPRVIIVYVRRRVGTRYCFLTRGGAFKERVCAIFVRKRVRICLSKRGRCLLETGTRARRYDGIFSKRARTFVYNICVPLMRILIHTAAHCNR